MTFQFSYLLIPGIRKAETIRRRRGGEAQDSGGGVMNVKGGGLVVVGQAGKGHFEALNTS